MPLPVVADHEEACREAFDILLLLIQLELDEGVVDTAQRPDDREALLAGGGEGTPLQLAELIGDNTDD